MKQHILFSLCVMMLMAQQLNAAEIQPARMMQLYAFADDDSGKVYEARIPVYSVARKIVCPTFSNYNEKSNFIDNLRTLLFDRAIVTHFSNAKESSSALQLGEKIFCAKDDGSMHTAYALPCLHTQSLSKLIFFLETAEYSDYPNSDTKENIDRAQRLLKWVNYESNNICALLYLQENDLEVIGTTDVSGLYVQKPLNESQFNEFQEAFAALYNHGVNKNNVSAHITATPMDFGVIKKDSTISAIKNNSAIQQ